MDNIFGNGKSQADLSDEENRQLVSQYRAIGPNAQQITFLERVSQEFDYVCLGNSSHAKQSIRLFALHPDTLGALTSARKNHFFLERSPIYDRIFSGDLSDDEFLEECFELRGSWIDYDNFYDALCKNMQQSMNNNGVRFVSIDQRFAGGDLFEDGSVSERVLSFPFRQSSRLQEYLYGRRSLRSPSMMLAVSPVSYSGQLLNDRDTVDEIIRIAPNGGTVFYGAGHFDDNRDWSFKRQDIPYLLREAGLSVCIININHNFDHRVHNHSDADLSVMTSEESLSGIRINNPAFEDFLDNSFKNARPEFD